MDPLATAIVGAGWMGQTHAQAVESAGDRVAVVVDADMERAESLAAATGSRAAMSLDAVDGVDAAVIATPSALHLQQAEAIVALGIPVLVEKPHRLPGEDPTALRVALERTGVRCQIGMTTRFHHGIAAAARAIQHGELGRILSYTDRMWFQLTPDTLAPWYFDPSTSGGGVVLTNGVHAFDRATWMLREDLCLVDASLHSVIPGHRTEDHASVRCQTHGGTPVNVSLLWSDYPVGESELTIIGTDGMARVGEDDWMIVTRSGTARGRTPRPAETFELQWVDFAGQVRGPATAGVGPVMQELEATLAFVETVYGREQVR